MIVRHFEIALHERKPPEENGWEQLPLGYHWMSKCMSAERRTRDEDLNNKRREAGYMTTGNFQQDCLLSILADIKREKVNFFELGAGWGRICLNLAGAIDFKLIQCIPERYRCLAVEAEVVHHQWLTEHFKKQNINGISVHGAVPDKNGSCHFGVYGRPDYDYGQAMTPFRSRRGIPSFRNIQAIITGKTVKVPMFTLDHLVQKYTFDHVDIVQMDV